MPQKIIEIVGSSTESARKLLRTRLQKRPRLFAG